MSGAFNCHHRWWMWKAGWWGHQSHWKLHSNGLWNRGLYWLHYSLNSQNQHPPSPATVSASGSSISFTYRVKAVSQQMTLFFIRGNIPECFVFSLIEDTAVWGCNAIISYIRTSYSYPECKGPLVGDDTATLLGLNCYCYWVLFFFFNIQR